MGDGKGGASVFEMKHMIGAFGTPRMLALLPAATLGAYWAGGETALIAAALGLPGAIALFGKFESPGRHSEDMRDALTGLCLREGVERALDDVLSGPDRKKKATACLTLEIDDFDLLIERMGHKAAEDVLRRVGERLQSVMRQFDVIARIDGPVFAVALAPVRRADLEALIQIAGRIQSAVSEPISLDATTIHISASVGFCLDSRAPEPTGEAMLEAALLAMQAARHNGPGAIRAFTPEMRKTRASRHALEEEVAHALEEGQITAWFQPQLSTDTGRVSGFEALARWVHPERGLISPADFLPAINRAGLSERLSEIMLHQSLAALRKWDQANFAVPQVGVNFSSDELRNPNLIEKIRWELDRFDLAPSRLAVEVLETVVAETDDDIITRNISQLARLGCAIDLDDFGTGHASIATIRRFAIGRIKIDRSFIIKVDQDPEQQRLVSAILTMAERLGLETLAEGVETIGEHAMLAQLGCNHVQGYGLARPMPFEDTLAWMQKHYEKLADTPRIGRRAG